MLSPESNRFDYGEQLSPPYIDGIQYEFDAAIATTYSLDLNTLLAVPIALCFNETLEGDLKGEKLVLLEAFGQMKGRLRVFYQKGNIKVPKRYNKLFALLEPCLRPVLPDGGQSASFHPKLWLLRYKQTGVDEKKAQIFYRLIVLSRNLTFDRSWDIAASLDGVIASEKQIELGTSSWADFFLNLVKEEQSDFTKIFKHELPKIKWSISYGRNPSLLPGGREFGKPIEVSGKHDAIMIVSPFLRGSSGETDALDGLADTVSGSKKYLLSRAAELNDIGEKELKEKKGWDCYSMNEALVVGAENNELAKGEQDLHAKIMITQRGATSHWHVGSANATTAALGKKNEVPRNNEFMLRFTGSTASIGPEAMLLSWRGKAEAESLFVPHKFTEDGHEQCLSDYDFRRVTYPLIEADWELEACLDAQSANYELTLVHNMSDELLAVIREQCDVEVGHLSLPNHFLNLAHDHRWFGVKLGEISALVPVRLTTKNEPNQQQKTLVIQARLTIEGGDSRAKRMLADLLNSEEKLLNYVRLLLEPRSAKEEWMELSKNKAGKKLGDGASLFESTPIYEQLMFAAARNPSALARIQTLLERIESTEVQVPQQFLSLWKHFESEFTHE